MTNPSPLMVSFSNQDGQAPSEVSLCLPNTPVNQFVTVAWGDGTSSVIYGGVGNRIAHSYGNPSYLPRYVVSVTGDASVVSFYDASGDRPKGYLVGWGTYNVNQITLPDLTVIYNLP